MDEVHEVRDATSGAEVLLPAAVAVWGSERELDRELAVVVMEGSATFASACTGDSLDEMGEGGKWWMVGRWWAAWPWA